MEETKETEVPTQTLSESSDPEEKSSEPVLKKAKLFCRWDVKKLERIEKTRRKRNWTVCWKTI